MIHTDSPTREVNVKNYFTRITNLIEMMLSECFERDRKKIA